MFKSKETEVECKAKSMSKPRTVQIDVLYVKLRLYKAKAI